MPLYTQERYIKNKTKVDWEVWRFDYPCNSISKNKFLRIEILSPAIVPWSVDGWKTTNETATRDTGLGIHAADLPTKAINEGDILFAFYWQDAQHWENNDFKITIANE